MGQELNHSSLFDVPRHGLEQVICFEWNTTHTTTFPKPYHMVYYSL